MNFRPEADITLPQPCPNCGTTDCGHTAEQKQFFAMEALEDASNYFERLSRGTLTVMVEVDLEEIEKVGASATDIENAITLKLNSGVLAFLKQNVGVNRWIKSIDFNWIP